MGRNAALVVLDFFWLTMADCRQGGRAMTKTVRKTIRFEAGDMDLLEQESRRDGRSISDVIRRIIDWHFTKRTTHVNGLTKKGRTR